MLKVAIIGAGGISDQHIQAYQKYRDRCQIVAIADLYPEKAAKKADSYGLEIPHFKDHQTLLENEEVDLVSICTPPFAHAEGTIDSLNAGAHVMLEKPMATSLAECDEILAAAKKNDRLLSVMAQNRFKRPLMKLKQVLDSGLIGKIIHAQVDSFWWRGSNYYDLWWRGTWEKEGGGCTMNHAVHHIDLFQWMAGMPNEVQAVITNLAHDNSEVEDFSTTVFFYENGALGQATASLVHHGEEQQVVIQGERAMVAIPWKVIASRQMSSGFPEDDPETAAEIQAYYEGLPDLVYTDFEGQIDNVLSTIAEEETLLIDGKSGRRTLELVTAIYQSGTTGKRVKLPLDPESPFYTREGILEAAPRFYEKTRSVENVETGEITFGRDF
ncbi:MAG: Gfo/Idh/MocA family oxidoreductase [Anaerolineales bacterium]|jgi:predicted dehydrogenase